MGDLFAPVKGITLEEKLVSSIGTISKVNMLAPKLLRILVSFILTTLFLVQCKNAADQLARETHVSEIYEESKQNLIFPSITLCPVYGFYNNLLLTLTKGYK